MSAFEIVHQDRIAGKLVCFDRMIFKGHLSRLNPSGGMRRSWTPRACCSSSSGRA
ncbi:MAG TPA: hypothetical protein VEM93_02610 [Actinomycetota bacterium]|nr:hypothetical protein [Actinomycetota bacterium]